MTRDEAIICLQGLLDNPLINKGSYLAQALEMAIKALEHPEQNVIAVVPCGDCISRQEALKLFATNDGKYLYEAIRDLPSVTSIPCSDAISRQAVMCILDEIGSDFDSPRNAVVSLDGIADAVHGLPSVTPQEPKTGRWILDETDNSITCDKCGCLIWANDISNGDAHYCPNCGAKMESEEQE